MKQLSGPPAVWLSAGLAVTAGSVDATGLIRTGRFSSHMTGTTTHVMVDLAERHLALVGLGLCAMVLFLCGAMVCGALVASRSARPARETLALIIALEGGVILIGGLALLDQNGGMPSAMLAIGLLAMAMGLQNALGTLLLSTSQRTTHLTSALTDLGSGVGAMLRGPDRRGRADASPGNGVMLGSAAVLAGFCSGGLAAGLAAIAFGPAVAPALAVLPLLIAVLLRRSTIRSPRATETA